MNEFGEPNMGNPSVRFDEGRSGSAGLTTAVSSNPPPSTSPTLLLERNQLAGRHDLSVLFDDDGKIYIISGNGNPYPIEELAPDLRSFVPNVQHHLTVPQGQRMGEGHHLYKIKGKYYDISAMPGGSSQPDDRQGRLD